MRLSFRARPNRAALRASANRTVEQLEPRTLLNATITSQLGAVTVAENSAATTINLDSHFNDPTVTGTVVLMQTTQGNIPIQLSGLSQIATTVQNFLAYVDNGSYTNTIIHRTQTVAADGIGIVQGGGYNTSLAPITTSAAIPLQYDLPNAAGTIAMARTSADDTATSQFFFNTSNNTQALGPNAGSDGYAVFGQLLYNGLQVAQTIDALPTTQVSTSDGLTQSTVPLQNYTSGDQATTANLVVVNSAAVASPLSYTVTSSNNSLVTPTISNDTLSLAYAGGQAGTASITVTATDLGGNQVTSTFNVSVGSIVGAGGAKSLKFTDANGTAATLTLTGPGDANVQFTGNAEGQTLSKSKVLTVVGTDLQIASIALTGTSSASTLTISGAGGAKTVEIGGVTTDGSLRAITAPQGDLTGALSVAGTLGNLTLKQSSGNDITITGTGGTLTLNIDTSVQDTMNSAQPVQLEGSSWGVLAADTITAPSITKIAVTKEFDATLSAASIGTITVGTIANGTWAVSGSVGNIVAASITGLTFSAGNVGKITSKGAFDDSNLVATGNIAAVSAATLVGTKIDAGSPPVDSHGIPTSFPTSATISTVSIGKGGFSDSVIGASNLGKVTLSSVTSTNGGTPFGLAATQILALTAVIDGKKLSLKNITSEQQVTAAETADGITANDLVISII